MLSKAVKRMFFLSCVVLLGLSGCAHYKARPLNKLKKNVAFQMDKPIISFTYDIFDRDDCKRYLDRNVIAKGFQPVHIMIANHSSRYLELSLANFSLPLVGAQEVAKLVHTSTAKRVITYGVLGLVIWPFLIPAVVDGIGSEKANERLDADFISKALRSQTIPPHGSVSGLLFVPYDDFYEDFSLTLIDGDSRERFMLSSLNPWIRIESSK